MLALAAHVRIFIACGVTDMRKGFDGLAARIERDLKANPYGARSIVTHPTAKACTPKKTSPAFLAICRRMRTRHTKE